MWPKLRMGWSLHGHDMMRSCLLVLAACATAPAAPPQVPAPAPIAPPPPAPHFEAGARMQIDNGALLQVGDRWLVSGVDLPPATGGPRLPTASWIAPWKGNAIAPRLFAFPSSGPLSPHYLDALISRDRTSFFVLGHHCPGFVVGGKALAPRARRDGYCGYQAGWIGALTDDGRVLWADNLDTIIDHRTPEDAPGWLGLDGTPDGAGGLWLLAGDRGSVFAVHIGESGGLIEKLPQRLPYNDAAFATTNGTQLAIDDHGNVFFVEVKPKTRRDGPIDADVSLVAVTRDGVRHQSPLFSARIATQNRHIAIVDGGGAVFAISSTTVAADGSYELHGRAARMSAAGTLEWSHDLWTGGAPAKLDLDREAASIDAIGQVASGTLPLDVYTPLPLAIDGAAATTAHTLVELDIATGRARASLPASLDRCLFVQRLLGDGGGLLAVGQPRRGCPAGPGYSELVQPLQRVPRAAETRSMR